MEKTLGGDRLGAGKREKVYMKNYERSTHDLGYVWRSTMASGTLVPFMSELALPGDSFDINLNCDVKTHPTIGPLFGSYKVQIDVFTIPIRLYQAQLHNNKVGIGLKMANIKLPQIEIKTKVSTRGDNIDNAQINPSCIFSYLGVRGIGFINEPGGTGIRRFNAIPYLGYWDIYKNYYANKQEEQGVVIHTNTTILVVKPTAVNLYGSTGGTAIPLTDSNLPPADGTPLTLTESAYLEVGFDDTTEAFDPYRLKISRKNILGTIIDNADSWIDGASMFGNWTKTTPGVWTGTMPTIQNLIAGSYDYVIEIGNQPPQLERFPLENIDKMREDILGAIATPDAFIINDTSLEPYGFPFGTNGTETAQQYNQEGLGIKTYQSDLFNNWISTEWIDGENGINDITAIQITDNQFTINELNLNNKIFNMLNRIAISGGSYDDWLDAVYTHERHRAIESPMYVGGLIKELVFQEVVSNSRSAGQPLGTLAGRGNLGQKHKGGEIRVRIDEPSYIMGIVSLTPRIDYSQGNKWDMNLRTMDDFHKPELSQIGFQDLITDQLAWFDTYAPLVAGDEPTYFSAGKQPAWINYMTNVNQVRGNFAEQTQQMFMVLNRRYESLGAGIVADLTTYIDPSKFNHIFADTRIDAQNFWVQIGINMTARRKMSAKVIPNL